MALTIEDGSGKADAQSYATVEELRGYATLRGATVPTADSACEQLLVKAMDFLEGQNFVGDRASATQALAWPRIGAVVEEWPLASSEVPRQLVQAQCALAIEAQTVDLLPTQDVDTPGPVVSESVGPVTTTYVNPGTVRRVPAVAKAEVLLRTLLKRGGLFAVRA